MSVVTPASSFRIELTEAYLDGIGSAPFIVGDRLSLRFQICDDDGEPIDLTGALAVWTMLDREGGTRTFVRSSASPGSEVVFDADQSAVSVDGATGKGWLQVEFYNADLADLAWYVGLLRPWGLRVTPSGGSEKTYSRGRIEWLWRR